MINYKLNKKESVMNVKAEEIYNKIKNSNPKEAEEFLEHNLGELLSDDFIYKDIVFFYLKTPNLQKIVKDNFNKFLIKAGYKVNYFIQEFISISDENRAFIIENMDNIISKELFKNFIEVINVLKGLDDDVRKKLNEVISHKQEIFSAGIVYAYKDLIGITDENVLKCGKTLSYIFQDVLNSENKKFSDIEIIGKGHYSIVIRIGEKVVKVGHARYSYYIPNHKRILQPIMRSNYTEDGNIIACFEVSNKVKMLSDEEIKQKSTSLYRIYKELRDDGIVWTDISWENVGILLGDNKPTLNGHAIDVDKKSEGFITDCVDKPLGKNEIVIIDTDYIFREKDLAIKWVSECSRFEKIYQKEKREEEQTR